MIEIGPELAIPEEELDFKASRSGGPGGQNVNKLNTRITLLFDVLHSPSLTGPQKTRILRKLKNRINKKGVLRIASQPFRTQAANRKAAINLLIQLLGQALRRQRPRKKTRVSAALKKRRLEEKRRRSRLKSLRSKSIPDDP
jgi:ribosome-associated protein